MLLKRKHRQSAHDLDGVHAQFDDVVRFGLTSALKSKKDSMGVERNKVLLCCLENSEFNRYIGIYDISQFQY